MFIRVTEEDIVKGERQSPLTCPLALAIKRRRDTEDVFVMNGAFTVAGEYKLLSNSGRKFVKAFDTGETVRPGIYWI